MSEHGDEQPVRIARVDDDLRDLLAVAQAQMRPRRAGVGGLVDAVAGGEVRPLQAFAAADVDDVRIGRRDRDGADRSGGLVVEDRRPRPAGVGRLPDAAVHGADVEHVGLRRNAGGGFRAAAAEGPDVAPVQLASSSAGSTRPTGWACGITLRDAPRRWRAASETTTGFGRIAIEVWFDQCLPAARQTQKPRGSGGVLRQGYGCDSIVAHEANSRRCRCGDRDRGRGSGRRSGRGVRPAGCRPTRSRRSSSATSGRRCHTGRVATSRSIRRTRASGTSRRRSAACGRPMNRGITFKPIFDATTDRSRCAASSSIRRTRTSSGSARARTQPAQRALRRRRLQVDRRRRDVEARRPRDVRAHRQDPDRPAQLERRLGRRRRGRCSRKAAASAASTRRPTAARRGPRRSRSTRTRASATSRSIRRIRTSCTRARISAGARRSDDRRRS